jgi:hypothetical protein
LSDRHLAVRRVTVVRRVLGAPMPNPEAVHPRVEVVRVGHEVAPPFILCFLHPTHLLLALGLDLPVSKAADEDANIGGKNDCCRRPSQER